jgi:hypothetical protein
MVHSALSNQFSPSLSLGPNSSTRVRTASFLRFLDYTQWHTTVGRTPLNEGSARRRDLYLTTHSTHNGQTFMSAAGFESTIPVSERPQTLALDRSATGVSNQCSLICVSTFDIAIEKVSGHFTDRTAGADLMCKAVMKIISMNFIK